MSLECDCESVSGGGGRGATCASTSARARISAVTTAELPVAAAQCSGVSLSLVRRLTWLAGSDARRTSALTTDTWPSAAAKWSGVVRSLLAHHGSAPPVIRSSAASEKPADAAQCSGVSPAGSRARSHGSGRVPHAGPAAASQDAGNFNNTIVAFQVPSLFVLVTGKLWCINSCRISTCPLTAAQWTGVFLSTSCSFV